MLDPPTHSCAQLLSWLGHVQSTLRYCHVKSWRKAGYVNWKIRLISWLITLKIILDLNDFEQLFRIYMCSSFMVYLNPNKPVEANIPHKKNRIDLKPGCKFEVVCCLKV